MKGDGDYFSQKQRVRIKDNKNSPHGKFHRFLFPFSSKFSDLNFPSYVLYNLLVLCHVSHTVSLGYLWQNERDGLPYRRGMETSQALGKTIHYASRSSLLWHNSRWRTNAS